MWGIGVVVRPMAAVPPGSALALSLDAAMDSNGGAEVGMVVAKHPPVYLLKSLHFLINDEEEYSKPTDELDQTVGQPMP